MSDDATKRLARIATLAAKETELLAQLHDVQREIVKLATGQDAIGDVLKRLEGCFEAEWARAYGGKAYMWNYKLDRPHWRRFIKLASEPDIIARIMAFFHAQRDDFAQRNGHRFGIFVSQFNGLAASVPQADHISEIQQDITATQQRLRNLRGN